MAALRAAAAAVGMLWCREKRGLSWRWGRCLQIRYQRWPVVWCCCEGLAAADSAARVLCDLRVKWDVLLREQLGSCEAWG